MPTARHDHPGSLGPRIWKMELRRAIFSLIGGRIVGGSEEQPAVELVVAVRLRCPATAAETDDSRQPRFALADAYVADASTSPRVKGKTFNLIGVRMQEP